MLPIAYALLIQLRNSNEDIKEHIGKYFLYGFCLSRIVPLWADRLLPQKRTNLILCRYNVDILNICMKEFCSEKIIFDKMTAVRT